MASQVPWTNIILEEFIRLGGLTKDEEWVMRTRVAGWPRTRQSAELHISIETLDRIIRRLKKKYDLVQPHSALLPPRRYSIKETWQDAH